ncbi:MAG TPA: hypothetical protein GXX18_08225, partial [Bacillales bacterium]|nr:hypothetical protein [Bacillales bacterium]
IHAYISPPIEESEVITEIQSYLHDKYQQEFIVPEIKYIPATKEYTMIAYPIEEPNLTFNVSKYSYSREIEENYLSEKWSKEAEVIYDTAINQLFPDNFRFRINVRIKDNQTELIPHDIQYQDLRESNAKELRHTIFIHTIQNSDTFNKSIESERIYKFIKHLKENNIYSASLDIHYYKTSLKQLLPKEGKIDPYNKKIDDYRLKVFSMSTMDYKTVKEPKDIENIFNF